jgi:uncharacterized integral membrane protein
MQFLKTIFWVVIAVLIAAFALNKWNQKAVFVAIYGEVGVQTPIWMVVLISFLAGLVPTLIVHRITRWSLRRRLENANRALTETVSPSVAARDVPPPGATPMAPPPGVA